MTKFFMNILLVAVICAVAATADKCRTKRGADEMATCQVDGVGVMYGKCDSLCCGGALHPRGPGVACCGSESSGTIINENTQTCCKQGNAHQVHAKTAGATCCGTNLFTPTQGTSCCAGPNPTVFNVLTDMCCEGRVSNVGNTAFGSCCGNEAYDRRYKTCPCHSGPAIYLQPGLKLVAECCRSKDGQTMSNYIPESQGCCDGHSFQKSSQVCCNGQVGNLATHMCCGNILVAKPLGTDPTLAGCCALLDGTQAAFDSASQICCAGQISTLLFPELPNVCCGGIISTGSDSCCVADDGSAAAYNSKTGMCCNGNAGPGNECCGSQPYYLGRQQCCKGAVSHLDFKWPSCCGHIPFDAHSQTCCGTTVHANPVTLDPETGLLMASHTTRCCGKLGPFDYLHGICCGGVVHGVDVDNFGTADCCGAGKIDTRMETCCNGVSNPKLYGESTACCGTAVIDNNLDICCDGVPRPLGSVPKASAKCCGDTCIDGSLYYCCGGKRYNKDGLSAADLSRLSCDFSPLLDDPAAESPVIDSPVLSASPIAASAIASGSPITARRISSPVASSPVQKKKVADSPFASAKENSGKEDSGKEESPEEELAEPKRYKGDFKDLLISLFGDMGIEV